MLKKVFALVFAVITVVSFASCTAEKEGRESLRVTAAEGATGIESQLALDMKHVLLPRYEFTEITEEYFNQEESRVYYEFYAKATEEDFTNYVELVKEERGYTDRRDNGADEHFYCAKNGRGYEIGVSYSDEDSIIYVYIIKQ